MLTTKQTIENLQGTEKAVLNLLDTIREVSTHLIGIPAPPTNQTTGNDDKPQGFINEANDANAQIILAVARCWEEIKYLRDSLVQPASPNVPAKTFAGKTMPKADLGEIDETKLAADVGQMLDGADSTEAQ